MPTVYIVEEVKDNKASPLTQENILIGEVTNIPEQVDWISENQLFSSPRWVSAHAEAANL